MNEPLRYYLLQSADEEQMKLLSARAGKEAAMRALFTRCMEMVEYMDKSHFQVFYSAVENTAGEVLNEMGLPPEKIKDQL